MKAITIHYAAEPTLRGRFALWLLEKGTPLHAMIKRRRRPWGLSAAQLAAYPEGTLGAALGKFYRQEGFEPIPRAERHDVFHVLLGFSTGVIDEASMQFFLWGNGKPSLFTIGTALITLGFFPSQYKVFFHAYRLGRRSVPIGKWEFQHLLYENTEVLRRRIVRQG